MIRKLFQPFTYIAGARSLLIGLVAICASTVCNYFSNNHFDGLLDAHAGMHAPFWLYIAEAVVYLTVPLMLFGIAGFALGSRRFRLIDLAGTQAMARWPMLFIALMAFTLPQQPIDLNNIPAIVIITGLADLLIAAWYVALLYQSYTVSCNIKGQRAIVSFIVLLLLSEVIVHYTIHYIYKTIDI
jgi:hypothetical protein